MHISTFDATKVVVETTLIDMHNNLQKVEESIM
jgi:hypothetical protein